MPIIGIPILQHQYQLQYPPPPLNRVLPQHTLYHSTNALVNLYHVTPAEVGN
jgi:hypothetical protein